MHARRAAIPPTSQATQVVGTTARLRGRHAPNLPGDPGWGHQCTPPAPPCPQPPELAQRQVQPVVALVRTLARRVAASSRRVGALGVNRRSAVPWTMPAAARSEEHTSELQSLMRITYAAFCLNKTKHTTQM